MNLTERMIAQVEWLKVAYAELILTDKADDLDYAQWKRMNTLLCYLEERLAR
jgi:hypothetical protein